MVKGILKISSKIFGIGFMFLAFYQWATFDYPDVNPFGIGAIFAPGMISQIFNWVFVVVLGSIGWGFFTLGKFKLGESTDESPRL